MTLTASILAAEAMSRIENLSPDQVAERQESANALVVDIREAHELAAAGQIPGAIHVPRGFLEFAADPGSPVFRPELVPERAVILVCASGMRSALGVESLQQLGFTDVSHLKGGMKAWAEAGNTVESVPQEGV